MKRSLRKRRIKGKANDAVDRSKKTLPSSGQPKLTFKRLPPADRRRQILDAAIAYFSEVGFDGTTRGLAERLGITQPLIYRYFPSKDQLIRVVYEEVYLNRWRGEWLEILGDRTIPIKDRLVVFYTRYTEAIFEAKWMRIYMFAGLRGLDINRRWIDFIESQVVEKICNEVRIEMGLPSSDRHSITHEEIDLYWMFHSGIFYYGVRCHVYGIRPKTDLKRFIELSIAGLLHGFPSTIAAVSV